MGLKEDRERNEILKEQLELLERIELYLRPKNMAEKIELKVKRINKLTGKQEEMTDMILQLNEDAKLTVSGIKDAAGNPALVDGALKWSVSGDTGIGDLVVDPADEKVASFVRNGGVGKVKVQVAADADLSPNEKLIVAEVELDCVGGEAVVIELNSVAVPKVP